MRSTEGSWLLMWVGLAVAGFACVGFACVAPLPVVRLDPRSSDVVWVAGRASIQTENAGVRVAAAFEHQMADRMSIRIEVENQTDGRLEIDPSDVTYASCTSNEASSCAGALPVINPEVVLAELDQKESRETADAVNDEIFLGSLVLLSAVADVASLAGGHAHHSTGTNTAVLAGDASSSAARHELTLQTIEAQQSVWSNAALRRTTLFPGRGISGLVYLPIDMDAKYVWVQIRAGGLAFPFCFDQTIIPIVTPPSRVPTRNH